MKTIQTTQTVGADGHIHLDIPAGRAGEEVQVLVVLSALDPQAETLDWPRFVAEMAGSCPDLESPADPPPLPLEESL